MEPDGYDVGALVYVLGVFAAMLALNWKLALIIMSIVPALAVLTWYFQNKILRWNRKVAQDQLPYHQWLQ